MAEPSAFQCTLCPCYSDSTFDSQKELADHLALHALVTSGKLLKSSCIDFSCYCSTCLRELKSFASASAHLRMHEQMNEASKTLASLKFVYEFLGSQVRCLCCNKLNRDIIRNTYGEQRGTKKDLFDSVSEFIQHFRSEHMTTAPKLVKCTWTRNVDGEKFTVHQCSFCGETTLTGDSPFDGLQAWWEAHIHEEHACMSKHAMIHHELVNMKVVLTLLTCHKQADSQSCLQFADNLIIKKIVKRIML